MPPSEHDTPLESRHAAILDLLGEAPIRNQAELQSLLKKAGHRATQATLSRDLRALGVVKTPQGYALPQGVGTGTAHGLAGVVAEWLLTVQTAQNQVVLHTPPGGAQALALALDRASLDGVLGTVAGDDTILVICPDAKAARSVAKRLQGWQGARADRTIRRRPPR